MSTLPDEGTIVTPRDLVLFRALSIARFLDCKQAMVVCGFTSMRRANRRLLKLVLAGLLRRWFVATSARGVKAIYGLSPQAAYLIGEVAHGLIPWKQDRVITSSQFLEHQQAINEIFVPVRFRTLPEGTSCERWMSFCEPLGASLPLTPDAYLKIGHGGTVHSMFLELDLGTESSKVWKRKVELYLRLAISGEFERMFHEKRFRVLVVLHSSRRLEQVRTTIVQRTDKLFWLSTQDELRNESLTAPIWLRPNGVQRLPLL